MSMTGTCCSVCEWQCVCAAGVRQCESTVAESDNLGSTDSEVKKILTLHLPISEYDTLGSDSEGDHSHHHASASQELVSFRHRMPRGQRLSLVINFILPNPPSLPYHPLYFSPVPSPSPLFSCIFILLLIIFLFQNIFTPHYHYC